MRKIDLNIVALANSESQPNSFVVILKEEEGNRRLPVVIGSFEAQAIAIAIENIEPNRPLTHDLLKNTLIALGVDLQEVIISDLRNGIFYATLIFIRSDGEKIELDSRTSDALALAVRFGCPISTYDFVMDEAGITFDNPPDEEISPAKGTLLEYSDEELEKMLEEALAKENYEKAAEIRDEINRRLKN